MVINWLKQKPKQVAELLPVSQLATAQGATEAHGAKAVSGKPMP
jgi:hypothetical protein